VKQTKRNLKLFNRIGHDQPVEASL
jgi:hypothetical protein